VNVLRPGSNLGFAAGCNLGARNAAGDVLVFLNPDTVVAPGAIGALADALEDPSVAIAMPRIRLLDEPDLLNSGGNVLHVAGLAWAGMFREAAESVGEIRDIPYASGTALAIRTRRFWELGGFTEELFLYQEDLELSWRAHMRGLRVVITPDADVYHDYDFTRHGVKTYFLERNRLIFLSTHFSYRLLALTLPVMLGAEAALVLLAAKEGWLKDKARAWTWCARNVPWLLHHRREAQGLRRVSDRELAGFLRATIDPGVRSVPRIVRAANPLVDRYWSLARRAL
jgi:GT2 family glycosyltransferase